MLLGEDQYFKDGKPDGSRRDYRVTGKFLVGFFKTGGDLGVLEDGEGEVTNARAKVTVAGILSQFCSPIPAVLHPPAVIWGPRE